MNFHTRRQKKGTSSKAVRSYFLDENGREMIPEESSFEQNGQTTTYYDYSTTSHTLTPDSEEIGTYLLTYLLIYMYVCIYVCMYFLVFGKYTSKF